MVKRSGWIKLTAILGVALSAVLVASAFPGFGSAQTAPPLGTAASFAVLAGTTVTNTNNTVIYGDLGLHPGTAVTGFPPGIVVPPGTIQAGNAIALQAKSDLVQAYNNLAGQACHPDNNLTGQDLGGMTLVPGVYCFDSAAGLTGTLTLNFQGNANAVFIFQIASTLITGSNASVVGINLGGGSPCNVYWQVGSSATLGTGTTFIGSILALTSIGLNSGATMSPGRALARNGAVTLNNNVIDIRACFSGEPLPTPTPGNGDNGNGDGNGNGDNGNGNGDNGNGNGDNGNGNGDNGNGNGDNGNGNGDNGNGNGDNGNGNGNGDNGNGNGDVQPTPTPSNGDNGNGNGNGDNGNGNGNGAVQPTPTPGIGDKGTITFPKTGTEGSVANDRDQFIASASFVFAIAVLLVGGAAYVATNRYRRE